MFGNKYRTQTLWFFGLMLVLAVLVWLLGPILTPFVIAAGLAYIGDPVVDRLELLKLPRTVGVSIVFLGITVVGLGLLILLAPMLQEQIGTLAKRVPDAAAYLQNTLLPKVGVTLPDRFSFDIEGLRTVVAENWSKAGGIAANLWGSVSASSAAVLAFTANLLLIPVVAFYLLRDWDLIVAKIGELVPPRFMSTVRELAEETDEVLSAFIRGQMLVMLSLSIIYVLGLYLVGLEIALLIGLIAGVISFVPYLGMIVGIGLATIAMLLQDPGWLPLIGVWLVFGAGQVLESAILTPLLVGDRIGLHPVAVIFAVLAGGHLFGFVGVLLALPMAAALAVLLRWAIRQWFKSAVYRRAEHEPDPDEVVVASELDSATAGHADEPRGRGEVAPARLVTEGPQAEATAQQHEPAQG